MGAKLSWPARLNTYGKTIILALAVFGMCQAWIKFTEYRFLHEPLQEPIRVSALENYSWTVRSRVSREFDLVVRFHKKVEPFDYVVKIVDDVEFRGELLDLSWELSRDGIVAGVGDRKDYGTHFRATILYVDRGIGRLRLSSNVDYRLSIQVESASPKFDLLDPEILVTPTVATTDRVFGNGLLLSLLARLGLYAAVLTGIFWLSKKAFAGIHRDSSQ